MLYVSYNHERSKLVFIFYKYCVHMMAFHHEYAYCYYPKAYDCPNMTSAVYRGHKATLQIEQKKAYACTTINLVKNLDFWLTSLSNSIFHVLQDCTDMQTAGFLYEQLHDRFSTRSNTSHAVQPQKIA